VARYLLDSDAVINHLRGIAESVIFIQALHQRGELLCACDVVIAEVHAGLHPQHRAAGERLLSTLTFLPTSPAIAQQAGQWRYDFARQGITLSTTDMLIAATAAAYGATILTGNLRHYPIPQLALQLLPRRNPATGDRP
jgi:predicted nucleic acid-binding protein